MSNKLTPLFLLTLFSVSCLGELNIGAVRIDGGTPIWPSNSLSGTEGGEVMGLEVAKGSDQDEAFGPIYFAVFYSKTDHNHATLPDTTEQRLGSRWTSSLMQKNTETYPYAIMSTFLAQLDEDGADHFDFSESKFGVGVDGGFGFRISLGSRFALDLQLTSSYTHFENTTITVSSRLGGALVYRY